MRIERVELQRLELELEVPLVTSAGEHRHRPLLLVRVETDEGVGVGECVALEEPTYTEEYADGAEAVLGAHLLPRLLAGGESSLAGVLARLDPVRGHAMAKAAVEMALLDAVLRADGISLAHFLGATKATIPAGANVSLGSPASVSAAVEVALAEGYRRVKVKIAPGHDVAVLRAVRTTFPFIALSADANGAYQLADLEHRRALLEIDTLGLTCLEQPLAPRALLDSARLCAELDTPVILDESVASVEDFEVAVTLAALDGLSVKPGRLGGLLAAKVVHDRCVALGLSLSIGGMLESGIGRATAIALAACPGFDLPGDLGASNRYFVPDLTAAHVLVDGELLVPSAPGIGVAVNELALQKALVRSLELRAP